MKMAGTYASLPNRARRSRSVGKASGTLLATSRSSLVLVGRVGSERVTTHPKLTGLAVTRSSLTTQRLSTDSWREIPIAPANAHDAGCGAIRSGAEDRQRQPVQ